MKVIRLTSKEIHKIIVAHVLAQENLPPDSFYDSTLTITSDGNVTAEVATGTLAEVRAHKTQRQAEAWIRRERWVEAK